MNKKDTIALLGGIFCIIGGLLCFGIETDQEFIDLPPTDEPRFIVPLSAGQTYEQRFVTYRKTITRIGAYMRPIREIPDPSAAVTFALMRGDTLLASQEVPAVFIENGGPTYARFSAPIATESGETLRMLITVPESISRTLALRTRAQDGSFSAQDAILFIDGAMQASPVAYNAFELIHPPLMKQIGASILLLGIFLLFRKHIMRHTMAATMALLLAIALMQAIPAPDASMSYGIIAALVFVLLLVAWWAFRIAGNTILGSTFGSILFACSTWLPLHMIRGWDINELLSIRNTLFDPNQIAVSHGAGAYIGVLGGFMALLGICIYLAVILQGRIRRHEVATIVAVAGGIASILAFVPSSFATPHAAIAVSFALAYFAAFAMSCLQRFFGKRDRAAYIVLTIFAAFTMLDLMHVAARSLMYNAPV